MMVTKTDKILRGDRNQCPTCGELFNSTYAFDKHRTGPWGIEDPDRKGFYLPAKRRCMTIDEMKNIGMVVASSGFWISAPSEMYPNPWAVMQNSDDHGEVGLG